MAVKIDNKFVLRITVYIASLAILAMAVTIAINSKLGVSPVNSLPFVLAHVLNVPLSTSIIIVYTFFVLLQIAILRKEFKPYLLLQIVFAITFGFFVDFFKFVLGDFALPTYPGKLVMVLFSALCIGIAVAMYTSVNLLPLPMEGLTSAISAAFKGKIKSHIVRLACDSTLVLTAISLSMIFLGSLVGIREGTVITALLVGPIVGLAQRYITPSIEKAVFDKTTPVIV